MLTGFQATEEVKKCCVLQIFLALPSNCPTEPDGSSRSIDGQTKADSVVLYASADEAQTFEQVGFQHLCLLCKSCTSPEITVSRCLSSCLLQHHPATCRSVCQSSGWTWATTL